MDAHSGAFWSIPVRSGPFLLLYLPICLHCVAGVQLFKHCGILTAGHCAAGVQLFKQCRNLTAGHRAAGCSCLRGVATYLSALCCSGAAV